MSTIIVLFNLKPGTDAGAYEDWARTTDIATVRSLASIGGFEVYKAAGLLGSDAASPYSYIEIIDVKDMDQFGADISTDTMKAVAEQFQGFADNPLFILTNSIEGVGA